MITTRSASVWTKFRLLLAIPRVQTRRSRVKCRQIVAFFTLKITRSCMAGRTKHDEHHQKALTKFTRHDTNRNKQEFHTNKNITPPPTRFPHRSKTAPFRTPPPPKRACVPTFFFRIDIPSRFQKKTVSILPHVRCAYFQRYRSEQVDLPWCHHGGTHHTTVLTR